MVEETAGDNGRAHRQGDPLTEAQRATVTLMVATLERTMLEIEQCLKGKAEGSLARARMDLTPEARRVIREGAKHLKEEAQILADRFHLHPRDESVAGALTGLLSVLWSDVEELRPKRLRAYGTVDPRAAAVLEPSVDRIVARLEEMFRQLSQDP